MLLLLLGIACRDKLDSRGSPTDSAGLPHTATPPTETGAPDSETDTESELESETETGAETETETETETEHTEPPPTWAAGQADAQIACAIAEAEGLATRLWWPSSEDARHGAVPVFVRVGGAGSVGWDIGHDPALATQNGAAVVQFLRPGTADPDGSASGGVDDFGGPGVRDAFACAVRFVRGEVNTLDGASREDLAPFLPGFVVGTGLSLGGGHVLNAAVGDATLPVDGVVMWESPLTDQITLQEMSPFGTLVGNFEPGSCTLDGGCPFPGRQEILRYHRSGVLWADANRDDVLDAGEAYFRPLIDQITGFSYVSTEMHAEVEANAAAVFAPVGGVPADWQDAASTEAFWLGWDAVASLRAVRDSGDDRPMFVLGSRLDHAQLVHEHTRVGLEGVSGARFFRLNPDSTYLGGLGETDLLEFPANTVVDDPVVLDALNEPRPDRQLLAAELEVVDRLHADVWDDDLDDVLFPVAITE
jgi:hypothetical protein